MTFESVFAAMADRAVRRVAKQLTREDVPLPRRTTALNGRQRYLLSLMDNWTTKAELAAKCHTIPQALNHSLTRLLEEGRIEQRPAPHRRWRTLQYKRKPE